MTDLDTRVRQAFDNVTVPDDVKRPCMRRPAEARRARPSRATATPMPKRAAAASTEKGPCVRA